MKKPLKKELMEGALNFFKDAQDEDEEEAGQEQGKEESEDDGNKDQEKEKNTNKNDGKGKKQKVAKRKAGVSTQKMIQKSAERLGCSPNHIEDLLKILKQVQDDDDENADDEEGNDDENADEEEGKEESEDDGNK